MNFDDLVKQITPSTYQRMKYAVETGKWPDGSSVTEQQRENCLQLVIAWDQRNLPEQQRTGWLPAKPAREPRETPAERPLRVLDSE